MGNIDIRQPNITGNDHEMLIALRSYLYQLCEQLQYAFDMLESGQGGAKGTTTVIQQMGGGVVSPSANANPELTFNSIKDMIIKSGDIARAYYKKIDNWLIEDKLFVVESDFGNYQESIKTELEATNGSITMNSEKMQAITNVFLPNADGSYAEIIKNQGYIKAGFLEEKTDGNNIYGIEIGLETARNENATVKVSRFTSEGVLLYDPYGAEGARLNNQGLEADRVNIQEKLTTGGFIDEIDDNGNIVTRWGGKRN